jgi:hypothetical protein
MPDFDDIHTQLRRPFRPVYEQLCENLFDPTSASRKTLKGLRFILSHYGDESVTLIRRIAGGIEPFQSQPLLRTAYDWAALTRAIDRVAQHSKGSKRAIGLAVRASKQLAKDVRAGRSYPHLDVELTKRFMLNANDAEFADVVPSMQPTNDASQAVIDERLIELRPPIEDEAEYFAE